MTFGEPRVYILKYTREGFDKSYRLINHVLCPTRNDLGRTRELNNVIKRRLRVAVRRLSVRKFSAPLRGCDVNDSFR